MVLSLDFISKGVSCYNVLIQTNYSIMPLSASGSYMLMIVMCYCGVDILL